MDINEKVKLLAGASRFDICSSPATKRKESGRDRIGAPTGICPSVGPDGRVVCLFKTLMTNSCSHDCKYCQNSSNCNKKATSFQPEELAKVFMRLYMRNYVEGLFLSSGVLKDSDFTTEKMLDCVKLLRRRYKFHGYIHLKALPGVNRDLLKQTSEYADRISINVEAPNKSRMSEICTNKDYGIDILRRQIWIKKLRPPGGQTTQFVVGGAGESDFEILKMMKWEYDNAEIKRPYFSAFTPIEDTPFEKREEVPLEREAKLYNTDWLLRVYKFKFTELTEILVNGMLPRGDPKMAFARRFIDSSIDINEAPYEELIKVPGVGPVTAERIVGLQGKGGDITKQQLHHMGVVLKRAMPFIKVNGMCQKTLAAF
jgi:putative DNA modification/repair radical SAM protein